jgi:hypothetical protein
MRWTSVEVRRPACDGSRIGLVQPSRFAVSGSAPTVSARATWKIAPSSAGGRGSGGDPYAGVSCSVSGTSTGPFTGVAGGGG